MGAAITGGGARGPAIACYLASAALHAVVLALLWRKAPVVPSAPAVSVIEVSLVRGPGAKKPEGEPGAAGGSMAEGSRTRRDPTDEERRAPREAAKREPRRGAPAPAPAAGEEPESPESEESQESASASSGGAEDSRADQPSERSGGAPAARASGTAEARLGGERGGSAPAGGGGHAGRDPGAGAPGQEGDPTLLLIIRRIEAAKRYPRAAQAMGVEGTVVVRFKLEPSGRVERVEVAESSGSGILDRASLETVRAASPFPYKEGWLKVGIVFQIHPR